MLTRIRKRLERYGVFFLYWIANRLTRESALKMAVFLADTAYRCMGRHRRLALQNIDVAFGDTISQERKNEISKNAFRSLVKTMIDFIRFGNYSESEFLALACRVEGLEHIAKALKDSQGGIIGLSSHIGSWEYAGSWLVLNGFPLSAVGKEQPDAEITKLMLKLRTRMGIVHIPRTKRGTKSIIKTLNSKKILGLIADQNGGKSGIFVPFFNKMASTFKGPAQLAMKKKVPIVMIAGLWEGNQYIVKFYPPIEMVDTGDENADLYENTYRCQQLIEEIVREYPDQWLWVHRRWKTRPPDEA